ncbi:universal stress protein [Mucilaginibacter flavidus]|uniref:universal stress protein n=1 Tax=Mucilaginibacter flavidus TaxID=2949309 RepID=UPI0020932889|nr:universal stress protein [Mucilaginibacter flavidus]MCO5948493.1 universal stress protein [Mucilaginibacter flavidus]
MKTILVLTDFSIKADYAAHYSLKLAASIKADLLLCNVFPEPSTDYISAQTGIPTVNANRFEEESISDLTELASRLTVEFEKNIPAGEFVPVIEPCSMAGSVANAVNWITANRHITMAVVGTHSNGLLGTIFQGDHTNEIIEKANCPVLVVPFQVPFHGFKKISFATDLSYNGVEVLHSLYGFAKYFGSEILITYVIEENSSDKEEQHVIKKFYNQIPTSANNLNVQYRTIKSNSVAAGLTWLSQHTDIDLLVLVHRKRSFFQKIFEESVTQKLAAHLVKPMLVFPGTKVYESLPIL